MKHLVTARVRIEKDKVTRVTRALRGKGMINVKAGQQVSPEEIIGSSNISAGFRMLNLATLLSVSPSGVETLLVRKIGQRIYKGELLALKKGWLGSKKVVTAPTDGVLDFLNKKTGELKITFLPKKIMLPAGVYGIVEAVDQERGQVIIRTLTSHVYGVLGSGRPRDGILHVLGKKDDLTIKSAIKLDYSEHVLVGGSFLFKDAISAAISAEVSGIITGGIDAKDYRAMAGGHLAFPKKLDNDIGISIVVCDGFGAVSLGMDIFEILSEYEGKFVFIDGNKSVISLPSPTSSSLERIKNTKLPEIQKNEPMLSFDDKEKLTELSIGQKVRVVGNYYLGEEGNVLAINDSLSQLPSGVSAYLATIETATRKIQVPVANLEIMM